MKDFVFDLIESEKKRQSEGLELIPSENYVSPEVLSAMGSVLTNKYSEGYPSFEGLKWKDNLEEVSEPAERNKIIARRGVETELEMSEEEISSAVLPNFRYYGGQTNVDRIERLAIARAMRLFKADHANVQPHSGANANEAVYYAWLEPGDTVLAMSLSAGGHLTHGAPVTRSAHAYNFVGYGVTEDGDIDYEDLEKKALDLKPKIILVGYSAFMKIPDFDRVAEIGRRTGALLMADMAHVAGLIAAGVHPNPLEHGFHVMTTTTHKTLRGPRGGLILSMGRVGSPLARPEKTLENIPTLIDRAVFPGTQGGPLEHVIAAKAVAFGEALKPEFADYARRIVENAQVLAVKLKDKGFVLQGDGTENHLILIDLKKTYKQLIDDRIKDLKDFPKKYVDILTKKTEIPVDGKMFEELLDKVGLTLNANAIPSDKGGAFRPSGVRLGTPAITTRGMGASEMEMIADWMWDIYITGIQLSCGLESADKMLEVIHQEVVELASKFPVPAIG